MTFLKKNINLFRKTFGLFLSFFFLALNIAPAKAADIKASNAALNMLTNTAQQANIVSGNADSASTIYEIIGEIINIVLGFLGVLFLILIIFGGIMWMTASGNEEKVKKATVLMTQAAIGLSIVLFAFLITNFVIFKIIGLATI